MADDATLKTIVDAIQKQIHAAVQFALDAPYPDPAEADRHVYA